MIVYSNSSLEHMAQSAGAEVLLFKLALAAPMGLPSRDEVSL